MSMPMVDVRVVRMLVHHEGVDVPVRMRLERIRAGFVVVLVVLVMGVGMAVSQRLVSMLVLMSLAQV